MHFVRRPFQFPQPLSQALLNSFWQGKEPAGKQQDVMATRLAQLWPTLAKGRGRSTEQQRHYSMEASLAEAYAAYYLPANAMKSALILEEIQQTRLPLLGESRTLKWADFGSGPGTALWGISWWAKHRDASIEYWGFEQSQQFLRLGERLGGELSKAIGATVRARWELFSASETALGDALGRAIPDVVSFVNSVGEMAEGLDERARLLDVVVNRLSSFSRRDQKPRWLVLVEPGSQAASRELLSIRDRLREREAAKGDLKIWLPCLNARPCGALARPDDWCHEEATCHFPPWLNSIGEKAGIRKEAVLFSYLVCSIGTHPPAPPAWPAQGKRVVSQLMREKGLDQCFLCTEGGKVKARVLRSRQTPENERFTESVRGQVFDSVELSEKGDVVKFTDPAFGAELDATVFPPLR